MTERMADTVVDRILNVWLLGTYSAQFNQLANDVPVAATEITTALGLGELGQGSLLAIDDELMYVADRDTTNRRLTVARGVRGTEAAQHTAGASIEVNPRFPRFLVRAAMLEEIEAWPDRLYRAQVTTLDLASGGTTLTVPSEVGGSEVFGVVQVRRGSLDHFDDRARRTEGYEVQWSPTVEGGRVVALHDDIALTTSFNLVLACRFDVDALDDMGDDCDLIGDVGLTRGMVEIVELGAAYRLLVGRGAVRLFPEAQGQSRAAQEVGARDIPAFASSLLGLRNQAELREVERLYGRFGFGGD